MSRQDRPPPTWQGSVPAHPARWSACGLGAALAGLGVIFLARPSFAAALFGLPAQDRTGYVRALGVRDLVLAGALWAAAFGPRRELGRTAALAALIPAGDILLVGRARGRSAAGSLALHAISMASLAGTALLAVGRAPGAAPRRFQSRR